MPYYKKEGVIPMKVKFLGHAGFRIDDLVIDPFITQNDQVKEKLTLDDAECNIICVTHDHIDHMGDAYALAEKNNATIVAVAEIAFQAQKDGYNAEPMNIGGEIPVGDWKIKMVQALHSSPSGTPVGFILKKGDRVIYHAGDTGLFKDMKLFRYHNVDTAILPIGDRFTMGVEDAAKAAEYVKCNTIIPMHYNTWPLIEADPEKLKEKVKQDVITFEPGETKQL